MKEMSSFPDCEDVRFEWWRFLSYQSVSLLHASIVFSIQCITDLLRSLKVHFNSLHLSVNTIYLILAGFSLNVRFNKQKEKKSCFLPPE